MRADLFVLVCASLIATVVSGCDAESPGGDDSDTPDDVDALETLDSGEPSDSSGDAADADSDAADAADADSAETDASDSADADTGPGDSGDSGDDTEVTVPCRFEPADPAFDDHTIRRVPSPDCFFEYAGEHERDPVVVKYVISDLFAGAAADAAIAFFQGGFYQLHDEWYWFRLLNGHPIPGLDSPQPLGGLSFASIAAVYQALAGRATLPLDLQFNADGRLYSPRFYALCGLGTSGDPRFFGVGSIVHHGPLAERAYPGEIWAFELEFSDVPTAPYLERVVAILESHLPPELAGRLQWIARSTAQEAVALTLRGSSHPLAERVLTYDDLVVEGAVEVYNEGIAAGQVNILAADFSPNDLQEDELAILPRVPDDIPPSRAILSAVPQTALAHVNLLAKSRGTLNAYVGGILSVGALQNWDWNNRPLMVEATEARGVRWKELTQEQYTIYQLALQPPIRHVAQVADLAAAPLTLSLSEGGVATMSELVPLVGGKSAGFLSFLEVPAIETPDAPLAISIKPFVEHQAELVPLFRAGFAAPDFQGDSRVRFLVLEGEDAFLADNGDDPQALGVLARFHAGHQDDALGSIVAAGGARRMLADKPMKYETLRDLRAALGGHFSFLARTQGLRFRSSSTAEDVPGFNGAGLYVSNTGFLYPSELSDPDDRAKTIEHAVKQTWASYWGFQAFEERRAGRIVHFEGNMGVAVHARFDDVKERANAVATFWWSDYTAPPTRRLVMNVQKGALAVTNPGGSLELPEIDEVVREVVREGERIVVTRVQRSTVAEPDEWLFSEAELATLFAQAEAHAGAWLAAQGAGVTLSERPRTLVLDYELKYVNAGWPALASGELRPERIIWRQARVLDQVVKVLASATDPWTPGGPRLAANLPGDLRTVARSLVAERCDSEWADLRVYRVYSEAAELFPFFATPFIYRVQVDFKKTPPGLAPSLNNWVVQWTNLDERSWSQSGTRITFNAGVAQALGIDGFELEPSPDGGFRVWQGEDEHRGACTFRQRMEPYQSAADYLRSLMPVD